MSEGILFCPGLHPSQQLRPMTDGDVVATGPEIDATLRVSTQAAGDSAAVSHHGTDVALSTKTQTPADDLSDLYTKPSRVVSCEQAEPERSTANEQMPAHQYGDASLQDSSARKPSLTGAPDELSFQLILS